MSYVLYRNSTVYDVESGEQTKDLALLNRDPRSVVLMDVKEHKTPQRENLVEVPTWDGQPEDTWLLDMIPFLELLAYSDGDVRAILPAYQGTNIPLVTAQNAMRAQKEQEAIAIVKAKEAQEQANQQGWLGSLAGFFREFAGGKRLSGVRPGSVG